MTDRERIVAWLREPVTARDWFRVYGFNPLAWFWFVPVKCLARQLRQIADAIERGEHEEKKENRDGE